MRILILAWFVVLASACSRYYEPPPQNLPLLSRKGEVQISPALCIFGPSIGLAASPLNHVGINANAWKTLTKTKLSYGELAMGYYNGFHKQFNFEVYGGYGHGKSSMNDTIRLFWYGSRYYKGEGSFDNYFIQANCGIDLDSMVDIALGVRYLTMNYHAKQIQNDYQTLHNVFYPGQGLEFSGVMRVGHKHIFGQLGGTISLMSVGNTNYSNMFTWCPLQLFVGLVIKL